MNLEKYVKEGIEAGWIRETPDSSTLLIDGKSESRPVYEVRVDKLRYNAQNGRIATYMSRYKDRNGGLPTDIKELDSIIEKMIEEDGPEQLKKTKFDIKMKGQQETAIVLSNGVVIDGNRRLTCLRILSREEGMPRYLRAHIFPDAYDANAIKGLELEIQIGKDAKKDYDPIARLVDINDWVLSGKMSEDVYRKHSGFTKSKMRAQVRQAQLLNEFLEWIDSPGAYHIAQDLKLQGPIESLASKLGKCKNEDESESLKAMLFANILVLSEGDRTRLIRDDMDNFLESYRADGEYAEEQIDFAERVLEKLEAREPEQVISTNYIKQSIMSDDGLRNEVKISHSRNKLQMDMHNAKEEQVKALNDALCSLEGVEPRMLIKLSHNQLLQMQLDLLKLENHIEFLKEKVTAELNSKTTE